MTAVDGHLLAVEELTVLIAGTAGWIRPVDRISLRVERGRTLALVGESGSGKSMLCRCLMGILPPRAAVDGRSRIRFDGRELLELPYRERSRIRGREMAVVLQNPMSSLNPVLTVGSQIAEPIMYHLGLGKRQAEQRGVELLEAVGIGRGGERWHSYPHELSGGMRQRVAIAIALSCDPKLLVADEPTTAIDVTVQAEILSLLGRLQAERGLSLILVSHDLGMVASRADDIAVMYAGRIVEQAPAERLFSGMRHPYTKALFEAIPRLDAPPHQRLPAIAGQPPGLPAGRAGCPFAPRCPAAAEICLNDEPPTATGSQGERHACWFPCGEETR